MFGIKNRKCLHIFPEQSKIDLLEFFYTRYKNRASYCSTIKLSLHKKILFNIRPVFSRLQNQKHFFLVHVVIFQILFGLIKW